MTCEHLSNTILNDVFTLVGVILLFFILREILNWFTKTNHILSGVHDNRVRLIRIEELLQRLLQ